MNRFLFLTFLLSLALVVQAQTLRQSLDSGWRFIERDVEGAEAVQFDDRAWLAVEVPHDWDIAHAPALDAATGNDGGYYPGGIGWYRRTFTAPKTTDSRTVSLHFEGVYQRASVYVNGQLAGTHAYGYTPFHLDITALLRCGKNTLAVRVDNAAQPNCRWYSGSGIYRHVWLEVYEAAALDDPRRLFLRTERLYGLSADGTHADSALLHITYEGRLDTLRTYRDVRLWSPAHPVLYPIEVGALAVPFGFRTFSYSAADGFRLNGQPMLLNGACVHHDDGVLGAQAYDAAEVRKARLMKEAGFNLVRTSHNPSTRAFLDACDSLGLFVIDEAFDGWYAKKTAHDYHEVIDSCYQEDLEAMVRRDRNHPSVLAWSIGNEVIERTELRVVTTARRMKRVVNSLDPTRPVTEALCSWNQGWEIFDPHAEVLDIVGYNYMIHMHESDHQRCPERVMWQTESYPREAFLNWTRAHDYSYIIGDVVWTGLDYLGESGIGQFYYDGEPRGEHFRGQHFPFHGAYCGDVDVTGWRKPISHYRDMLYNIAEGDTSYLYLAVREPNHYLHGEVTETLWSVWPTWPSWTWPHREGHDVEVVVYTKAPAVRLTLNGVEVGTQTVSRATAYKTVFRLPYQPGTLRAVCLNADGREGASSTLVTAGAPAALRLTPDRRILAATGQDLCYVTIEVVDAEGHVVPDAALTGEVSVSGRATLLAAASANMKDLEPTPSPRFTTYRGRAVVVVRSQAAKGSATLRINTPSLPTAYLSLSVK